MKETKREQPRGPHVVFWKWCRRCRFRWDPFFCVGGETLAFAFFLTFWILLSHAFVLHWWWDDILNMTHDDMTCMYPTVLWSESYQLSPTTLIFVGVLYWTDWLRGANTTQTHHVSWQLFNVLHAVIHFNKTRVDFFAFVFSLYTRSLVFYIQVYTCLIRCKITPRVF